MEQASAVVMEEASGPDMEAAAVLVAAASAMAVWAYTALVFSGTACFSMLFRSITQRIGGMAVRTIMRTTISTSGTHR
jgi:hypothetical protein